MSNENQTQDLQFLNDMITSNNPIPMPSISPNEEKTDNTQILMPPVYSNPIPNNLNGNEDNIINEGNSNNQSTQNDSAEIISNPIMNIEFNLPKEKEENNNDSVFKNETKENIENYRLTISQSNEKLTEPISDSLKRDLFLIYTKLKYVINPFKSNNEKNKHIKQWDLWGPLLFTCLLSITLAIRANQKEDIFILIFVIFWIGSLLVFINSHLLEIKLSIFHIFCLLGYCMFPLNISALILMAFKFHEFFRIIIIILGCVWSTFSASGFLKSIIDEDDIRGLVLYPVILLYLFLSGVILMNRF